MFTFNNTPITAAAILAAPVEARQALLPDLVRFFPQSRFTWFSEETATVILGLNGRNWEGEPHSILADLVAAVEAGTFTLTEATPTERSDGQPKDRADQHAALLAMRRREADAIRRMIDAEQRVRDLEGTTVTVVPAAVDDQPLTDWNDPRLRPLLTNVYQVATDQNHCGEFEQIMGAVGGPDRFELGATRAMAATIQGYVEVSYTVSYSERVYVTAETEFEGRSSHTGQEDYNRAVEEEEIDPAELLSERIYDDPSAYLAHYNSGDDASVDDVTVTESYATGIHRI